MIDISTTHIHLTFLIGQTTGPGCKCSFQAVVYHLFSVCRFSDGLHQAPATLPCQPNARPGDAQKAPVTQVTNYTDPINPSIGSDDGKGDNS